MKKAVKILAVLVMLVAIAAVGTGARLVHVARNSLPSLEGTVTHPSLKAEVRVIRDEWGIPHIEAANEPDAYFALGYVMAQDRLFQMELLLRLASGELSELVGPLAVPVDEIMRALRLPQKAEETVSSGKAVTPGLMAAAEAFVAGINHMVETEPLPFEFRLLRIPRRVYTVADCLTVGAIMPITFADGLREDPLVSVLKERQPDLDIDALFPGYSREVPITIMETLEEAEAYLAAQAAGTEGTAPQASAERPMEDYRVILLALQGLSDLFGPAMGSNSWVLGPSRTKSGKPLLANDPHIGFTNPSVWYEAHVTFPGFDLYGYYMALIPFALLGHTSHHAWGLTMFANDDIDLFQEEFHPDDENKVKYKGEWTDVETEEQVIKVRFGKDQHYTVRVTPHGPLITDAFRWFHHYRGPDIALSWSWQHVPYTDALALYEMGHAKDCASFGEAVSKITSPGINVSYVDGEGNFAWWAAGLIPIRPDHVNPKTLLDGASGKDEVLGYVPFEQNPHLLNPECGYIATANNMSTVKPVGPVKQLQGYWQPGDRAGRIEEIISARDDWTLEDMKAVQFDDTAYAAPMVVECILGAIGGTGSLSEFEAQAYGVLESWDYAHGVDSAGAALYQKLCRALQHRALEDEIGPDLFPVYGTVADHWNFFKYLVQHPESPFWDDINTPEKETMSDVVLTSFREAAGSLRRELGDDVSQWRWGVIHTMEFKHPLGYVPFLSRYFNIGPFPASGGAQIVNNMLYASGSRNFDVIAGPSTRRLIDYGDPDHSLTVIPTGNSGNFMSPNYDDQAGMFMAGEYRQPYVTKGQVEAHKVHELRFSPGA